MGKAARNTRKAKRLKAKRALKMQNVAKYEALKKAGANKKSKRFVKASQAAHFNTTAKELRPVPVRRKGVVVKQMRIVHGGPMCGNIGCLRCSEVARRAA